MSRSADDLTPVASHGSNRRVIERFALNPALDAEQIACAFARDGLVSVPGILEPDCAVSLQAMLRERGDWIQVIGGTEKLVELDRATRDALSAEQQAQLDLAVYAGARSGFQFRYEAIRVPDDEAERRASDDPLAAFARWWSSGEVRAFFRTVTRQPAIAFADAQATAYSPGDFLTGHDDDFPGKNRVAAYVLNLTPQWRMEWGGLIAFHDEGSVQAHALMPDFNRLNLFRVPRRHSVTEVSRAAAYRRYAITGWLRQA